MYSVTVAYHLTLCSNKIGTHNERIIDTCMLLLLASERSERDTLWSVQLRIADILSYIYIVRAIFVLITRKEGGA